jgi:electron transport complex protein RnfG
MNIKKSLKDVVVLLVICSVFAVVLAAVNSVTAPIIADRLSAAADEAYMAVLPGATGFEDVDISKLSNIPTVKEAKKEKSGLGYAIKLETKGYATGLVLIVGVDANGVVTGATCIASNETWGLETSLGEKFVGKDVNSVVDVEAGVTSYTVNGYRAAVKDAINAATILSGGQADTRTEEEIFFDNLKEALPEAFTETATKYDEVFTQTLIVGNDGNIHTNKELSVDSINKAINGKGYVFVVGKEFVGVNAEGVIVSEVSAEAKAIVEAAIALDATATATEIDTTEYKNSDDRTVKRAFNNMKYVLKTESGIYVMETSATGYGKTPMTIIITVSADGKIIDNLVVTHSETGNYGGAKVQDGEYNQNFVGKNQEEANAVDTVTGVTVTTNAYKNAVLRAYVIVSTLEGGATNE